MLRLIKPIKEGPSYQIFFSLIIVFILGWALQKLNGALTILQIPQISKFPVKDLSPTLEPPFHPPGRNQTLAWNRMIQELAAYPEMGVVLDQMEDLVLENWVGVFRKSRGAFGIERRGNRVRIHQTWLFLDDFEKGLSLIEIFEPEVDLNWGHLELQFYLFRELKKLEFVLSRAKKEPNLTKRIKKRWDFKEEGDESMVLSPGIEKILDFGTNSLFYKIDRNWAPGDLLNWMERGFGSYPLSLTKTPFSWPTNLLSEGEKIKNSFLEAFNP